MYGLYSCESLNSVNPCDIHLIKFLHHGDSQYTILFSQCSCPTISCCVHGALTISLTIEDIPNLIPCLWWQRQAKKLYYLYSKVVTRFWSNVTIRGRTELCPSADLALLGMVRLTFPKNILDRQSQTAALAPLGILVNIWHTDPELICKTFSGKSKTCHP